MNISLCLVTMMDLWGIYQGLKMAWQQGYNWLSVEVDSLCVTQLVSTLVVQANEHASLLQAIKDLIKQGWHISVQYVYCEANHAAGFMTTYAFLVPPGLHTFTQPPYGLASIVTYPD